MHLLFFSTLLLLCVLLWRSLLKSNRLSDLLRKQTDLAPVPDTLGTIQKNQEQGDQYERNVATSGTSERVEYAIKLPGHSGNGVPVWLPIDAKFPVEDSQRLIEASERGDVEAVDRASRQLAAILKACAKRLHDKYIAPPATTEFAILFLSTEGLNVEAMRRTGLGEFIQREHRIVSWRGLARSRRC